MRITQELPVNLTDSELVVKAEELVDVLNRRRDLEAEKADVNKGYAKQIAGTEATEKEITRILEHKSELRDVECLETEVPGTNEVVVVRLDTGAEISRRQITPAETQGDMFADEELDEMRAKVLATLALQEALKTAGVNATSDVLWEVTPEQADEARAWATLKATDETAAQPEWLAELVLQHPAVEEVPAEAVATEDGAEAETDAETTAADDNAGEAPAGAVETASDAAPATEPASQPTAPKAKRKSGGKKGAGSPETESAEQKKQAAASNGRLDEVDVQEELDAIGVSVGLDVIAGWKPEQLIDAVNYSRVVVARRTDETLAEPKRPAFLPAA